MSLIAIAFRNLGRKRSRTALSVLAVAVGVFAVILAKAYIDGILSGVVDNTIRLSSGHVRVIDKEYRVKERLLSLNYPVDGFKGEGYQPMAEAFAKARNVDLVAPRLRFAAMVSKGDELQGVMAMGVDPAAEEKLIRLSRYIDDGRFVSLGKREAVMGARLLAELGLAVGDKFTMVFNTAFGGLKGYTFTVVGAIESGLAYLDDGLVFVPLDVAQDILDMGPAVTELLVMAKSEGQVPGVLREINGIIEEKGASERYVAVPWYQQSGFLESLTMMRTAYMIVYLFILFLANFVVINTMVMIVNERRREIGMLSALGLKPAQIHTLFMLEGGITGVLGSTIGTVLGGMAAKVLSVVGTPIPGTSSLDPRFLIAPRVYAEFSFEVVGFAFFAGILVTLIAVWGPSRLAARMEPTQALRA